MKKDLGFGFKEFSGCGSFYLDWEDMGINEFMEKG